MQERDRYSFDDRTIIVTGAASGMGLATARRLRELGATVYAADVNESALAEACVEIGAKARVIDVSRPEQCRELVDTVCREQGQLDGTVNFAGILKRSGLLDCDDAEFDRVLDVNVRGCFYLCREAARVMKQQGYGSIVNVSSIWSDIAAPGVFAYCVSKGAVSQITRSAALDLAGTGVRVNEVRPGETNTPMLASERGHRLSGDEIEQVLARIAQSIPERRLAEPREIASAAIFLLSDESSYMQGASITVDGAYTVC